MVYAYIRVSSEKQTTENQRFEILKFADEKSLKVDEWIEETISTTKKLEERKLAGLIQRLTKSDVLICSELSRLGRSIMEVMSILKTLMEKDVRVLTTKERYELGNNINSKVLAFAFSLSAEIERNMISQRTKEALQRKKSEGKRLGRPKGSLAKTTKLTGKDEEIVKLLDKKVAVSAIARVLGVNRMTLSKHIQTRNLLPTTPKTTTKPIKQPKRKPPPTLSKPFLEQSIEKKIKVCLYLRIEVNTKGGRGLAKARKMIELLYLQPYQMKKYDPKGWEYELTIPYETDEDLDETIYELLNDMESTANDYLCWTESDVSEIDGERSW